MWIFCLTKNHFLRFLIPYIDGNGENEELPRRQQLQQQKRGCHLQPICQNKQWTEGTDEKQGRNPVSAFFVCVFLLRNLFFVTTTMAVWWNFLTFFANTTQVSSIGSYRDGKKSNAIQKNRKSVSNFFFVFFVFFHHAVDCCFFVDHD